MIFKQATVKGFWGSKASRDMSVDDKRRLVGELIQRASNGELRLPVEAVYDLADIEQAAAASLQPGRSGKVLQRDRKSVGTGKSVSVRGDFGGRRPVKKKKAEK